MTRKIKYDRRNSLSVLTLVLAVISLIPVGFSKINSHQSNLSYMQRKGNELSSLKWANAWLNSKAMTEADLKGKVVLIQFGTYTCINWIRTLPYVRGWAEKYKDKGLVSIAVHTPEFPFEKSIDNISRAIKEMQVNFPVAVDNKQGIWNAFDNQYWPALYLIDVKGRIRHHQFGEGGYDKSEKFIQQLLIEAGAKDISEDVLTVNAQGAEAAADWSNLRSPENYLGYKRTENFVGPDFLGKGRHNVYTPPPHLELNHWSLAGDWTVENKSIILNKANGRIAYRFHSRDVNLVMGPAVQGTIIRFHVSIDGKPPVAAYGIDIDEQGNGTVTYQRMYQLIRQGNPINDRMFEIEFLDGDVEAFAFTFG